MNAWIDPQGKEYPVALTCHYLVANDILPNVKNAYQMLLRRGWMRVSMPQGRRTWAGIELRPRSGRADGELVYQTLAKYVRRLFKEHRVSGVTIEVIGKGVWSTTDLQYATDFRALRALVFGGFKRDKYSSLV